MNLAKEISFLLYKHNCVILPGFGAFLVNEKAAELNEVARYALPKQKVITFNKQIEHNDGLVANYLSQQMNCTYEQGLENIDKYKEYLWQILHTKRNVEVAEVGTFYYTQEEKLVFVPYHSVNFSAASYGLPKLRLKPITISEQIAIPAQKAPIEIIDEVVEPVLAVVETQTDYKAELKATRDKERKVKRELAQQEKQEKKALRKTKVKNTYGKLSLVNTLGSLFLIAMVFAMLNFEMTATPAPQSETETASLLATPTADTASTEDITKTEIVAPKTTPTFGIYAQVKNEEEATNLVQELQGKYTQAAVALDQNGKTCVFIISFMNEELATEYKNLIQNKLDQKLVINNK